MSELEFYNRLAEEDKYFSAQEILDKEIQRKDWEREQYRKLDKERIDKIEDINDLYEYATPMEDIFEAIEEIVFHKSFCLHPQYNKDLLLDRCVECGAENITEEEVNHLATCRLNVLRDLIATLGDMIS